ncbi:MAG: hypothetical protein NTY60_06260, partial [Proteobacteria bacterium]|nr:hypothetical protein [Pseudomonadota bacterium]
MNFISDAIQAFSGWVDDLERQGYVSIEARALIALARQIESGVDAPEQGIPEAVISEPVTPEAVISEPVTPEAVIPEAVISEAVISEAVIPEAAIPEAVTPEAVTPEAVISEPVIPEAVIPEAVLPEAVLPEAVLPEPVIPEPVIPEPAADRELDFAEPESVVIGEIAVSPTLFKIASEEASQNVLALHRQLEELMAASPV